MFLVLVLFAIVSSLSSLSRYTDLPPLLSIPPQICLEFPLRRSSFQNLREWRSDAFRLNLTSEKHTTCQTDQLSSYINHVANAYHGMLLCVLVLSVNLLAVLFLCLAGASYISGLPN